MKIFLNRILLLFVALIMLSACQTSDEIVLIEGERADFIVTGASGDEIVLDRTWYRECISSAIPNVWSSSQRTLSSNELATTEMLYGSSDCTTDLLMVDVIVASLTIQENPTQISWVEMDGLTPSADPAGLESVNEANSVLYTINTAKRTPVTQAQADLLNAVPELGFGMSDWAPGVTKDISPILSQFANPGSATIVVKDDIGEGCVYDGIPDFTSEEQFPSNIGNIPHCGPLHTQ